MLLLPKRLFLCKKNLSAQLKVVANYSRKSDSKNFGNYKIVKSNDVIEDVVDLKFGAIANWELLAPRGYRFVLPGSLGPAWHEAGSMIPVHLFGKYNGKPFKPGFDSLECIAQDCPLLLRKGVLELFPGSEICSSQIITVVTLAHKKGDSKSKYSDTESEYYAKTFIWTAQEICMRLKLAGYWADFINPFSGKPYLSPFYKSTLYETDERFRCIGFEIRNSGNCKTIQSRKGSQFVGSLYTNAPASTSFLYELLNEE